MQLHLKLMIKEECVVEFGRKADSYVQPTDMRDMKQELSKPGQISYLTRAPTLRMSQFVETVMVGEGTYGKVFRCKLNDRQGACWSDSFRAVKRIKYQSEKDGFPITALREIQVL